MLPRSSMNPYVMLQFIYDEMYTEQKHYVLHNYHSVFHQPVLRLMHYVQRKRMLFVHISIIRHIPPR